jgi:DegV family protein with EDD domain
MPVKVVTDSTCDLPEALIRQYGITVAPMYINVGVTSYRDGLDLSREAFYQQLPTFPTHPSTATPSPAQFRQIYTDLAAQGASEILSLHISVKLSSVLNAARLGAEEIRSAYVAVVDSRQLSLGTGFVVLAAAQAAAAGEPLAKIVALIDDLIPRVRVFAALDTLEFLRRSGRMSGAMARLGNLLQVKPVLQMVDGQPKAERVRTRERADALMLQWLEKLAPLEQVALVHTHTADRAEALRQKAQHLLPPGNTLSVDITPVFGVHLGPGAAGFACVTQAR